MEFTSVNKIYQESFRKNWDRPAISNYQGMTLHYRDVARRIEKMHIMFEGCGLQKGDKVAICSRNQANWAVAFLSAMTYGAVPVPLLHEFKSSNIHHLVNHSEAKILFVDEVIWEGLSETEMPDLHAIIQVNTFKLLYARDEGIVEAREHLNELFGRKYPMSFTPDAINYYEDSADELAVINYTSGTSGFSKGVMIPYRAILSNLHFASVVLPGMNNTHSVVSMLPCAHMYGLMFELMYELSVGAHVHFLSRVPSPKIIMKALAEVKPYVVIAVPLVIEKIYKSKVKPILEKEGVRFLMKVPGVNQVIMNKIRTELVNAFGGEFYEVIIGGAAFNKEVEAFFKKMGFPFTVGYGMTECAPIICYEDWQKFKAGSCGKTAPRMEVQILSPDPQNIVGEIVCKGDNVMLGYYKNPEATAEVIDKDGWMHTGDLGVMDAEGNVTIKGRSKNMLLGPSGQNIYPEEIEDKLNNMPYVAESIVIQQADGKLAALIYPDFDDAFAHGLDEQAVEKAMEENRVALNTELPAYEQIARVKIYHEEFEKTPKKSIKRFLYQEVR